MVEQLGLGRIGQDRSEGRQGKAGPEHRHAVSSV
jgi:hypothetical protein